MSLWVKTMAKWPLQTTVIEKISWKVQSAVVVALVGISSKIYLGNFKYFFFIDHC